MVNNIETNPKKKETFLILLESSLLVFIINPQFLLAYGIYGSSPSFSYLHLILGIAFAFIILAWLYTSMQRRSYSRVDLGLTQGYLPEFMVNNIYATFADLCIIYFGPMIYYTWVTIGHSADILIFLIFDMLFIPFFDELIFR